MGAEIITIRVVTSIEIDIDLESSVIAALQSSPGSHMYLVSDEMNQMFHAVEPFIRRDKYSDYLKNHLELESVTVWQGTRTEFEEWFQQYEGKTPYMSRKMFGFLTWFEFMRGWLSTGRKGATCQWFACWFMIDKVGRPEFEQCEFMMPVKVMALVKHLIPYYTTVNGTPSL